MEAALLQEIQWRGKELEGEISTIYFGGGTPSLFPEDSLGRLMKAVSVFSSNWREVTLEANPEDITLKKLEGWLESGITRLSIGVQTFDNARLNWMNRAHTGAEAEQAIHLAAQAGFKHITADLIYGLPDRGLDAWKADVDRLLSLPIDHLSAYILTIEPRTVLGHQVQHGKQAVSTDESIALEYAFLCEQTQRAGFEHYEVSNFARPGGHALHNQNYWSGVPYWGIGPGAHGFDGVNRYAHVSNNQRYIRNVQQASSWIDLPVEVDSLTQQDRFNEGILTGLRTATGINPSALKKASGHDLIQAEAEAWGNGISSGELVEIHPGQFRISEKSWLLADAISARFFWVN